MSVGPQLPWEEMVASSASASAQENAGHEGQSVDVANGRHTPIVHRRPLQRISLNTVGLSPTKRRRQSRVEDTPPANDKLTPSRVRRDEEFARSPFKRERQAGNMWHEVLARLSVRDIVDHASPVCKLWREVCHSKELWALLRPHVRLVEQLVITEKVVERRSKGRLFRCRRLGTGDSVLLRVVDLELTNAGKDDGIPTSFLREAALLSRLRHPNVVRNFGSEVLGKRAIMCTEFVHESFTPWFKRLETLASPERATVIHCKFHQVLEGLSYLHHQGVMHRNLKPDNIFMDPSGVVKLGDFTTTRMMDVPFQAYTPEDPKERDRSGREMRRLWYRAPEIILRDEVYGPKVDIWSVGCLLAEAATGRALFQSDSEIDHLFRMFRLIGTPSAASWPEVVGMKNFSPKFPVYSGFDLAQVARAACRGSSVDEAALMRQAAPDRSEVLQNILSVAAVLGPEGMCTLDQMLMVPPSSRAGADAVLASPFFAAVATPQRQLGLAAGNATVPWLQGDTVEHAVFREVPALPGTAGRNEHVKACPAVAVMANFASPRMVWDMLNVMKEKEQEFMMGIRDSLSSCMGLGNGLPRLPTGFDAYQRTLVMDYVVGMANAMNLTDYTLHLAASILDKYLASKEDGAAVNAEIKVAGATCLKIADCFCEQSKEYYKQENASEYEEASNGVATAEQVLNCEKEMLLKLGFDLHIPTTMWFLKCYLTYARLSPNGHVAKTASFISDLTLLDYDVLAHAPSLRAQCALVLATFLEQARTNRSQSGSAATATAAPGPMEPSSTSDSTVVQFSASTIATPLTYLRHWDEHVRDQVCHGNAAVDASLALQAVVRTLVVMRRDWKSQKLESVEVKHAMNLRTLAYPESFPVSKLVRYILPDSQRGLLPE